MWIESSERERIWQERQFVRIFFAFTVADVVNAVLSSNLTFLVTFPLAMYLMYSWTCLVFHRLSISNSAAVTHSSLQNFSLVTYLFHIPLSINLALSLYSTINFLQHEWNENYSPDRCTVVLCVLIFFYPFSFLSFPSFQLPTRSINPISTKNLFFQVRSFFLSRRRIPFGIGINRDWSFIQKKESKETATNCGC